MVVCAQIRSFFSLLLLLFEKLKNGGDGELSAILFADCWVMSGLCFCAYATYNFVHFSVRVEIDVAKLVIFFGCCGRVKKDLKREREWKIEHILLPIITLFFESFQSTFLCWMRIDSKKKNKIKKEKEKKTQTSKMKYELWPLNNISSSCHLHTF